MITNYFVQHGLAEPKDVDVTRPLSAEGVDQVRKVATKLHQSGVEVKKIVHSGKLRAAQTAQFFSQVLQVNEVLELNGMNPNDDPKNIIGQLSDEAVMYVGHLPNIQKVVSYLLSNGKNDAVVKFTNAAVACVEVEKDEASLKWYLTPELC